MVSKEVSEIESKTFSLSVNGEVKLVEFRIAELPNDMKMLAFWQVSCQMQQLTPVHSSM